ncbi:MAG: DNA repair protein RecO [Planctomycetia bacterium]|nr:DNA repair protein RecO [Planctomycetia bacterium]
MGTISDDAIILRTVDFSESSMVVTFLTREHGKISALAKGARRLRNPFDSALDYMNLCRILYYPKKGDALDLVTEAKLLTRFDVSTLPAIYAGFHVLEFLEEFTEKSLPQTALFDLTKKTLNDIVSLDSQCRDSTLEHPPEILSRCLLHFELRVLEEVGLAPSFRECVECSANVMAEPGKRVALGMLDGGVLCSRCRPGHRKVVSLSKQALGALQQLAHPGESWKNLRIGPKILGELRSVWNQYLAHQLEHPVAIFQWFKR